MALDSAFGSRYRCRAALENLYCSPTLTKGTRLARMSFLSVRGCIRSSAAVSFTVRTSFDALRASFSIMAYPTTGTGRISKRSMGVVSFHCDLSSSSSACRRSRAWTREIGEENQSLPFRVYSVTSIPPMTTWRVFPIASRCPLSSRHVLQRDAKHLGDFAVDAEALTFSFEITGHKRGSDP